MKVKKKRSWRGEKFIIRLVSKDRNDRLVEKTLANILFFLTNLSRLPYRSLLGFDYICKMVWEAGELFTAISNIEKILREGPSFRYLSQEEKERLRTQRKKIDDLLNEVLSKLQEMVKTTPEGVQEAEAQKPETSVPTEE